MPPFDDDDDETKPGKSKAPDWMLLSLLVFGSGTFGPQLGNMMPGSAGDKILSQFEEVRQDMREVKKSISDAEDRADECCSRVSKLEWQTRLQTASGQLRADK